jgi:peptidyl-dipeptidase Dcp
MRKRKIKKSIWIFSKIFNLGKMFWQKPINYFKHITDKKDLAGIPEAILAQYEEAKERNLEGYVIASISELYSVLTYAENRELRKIGFENGKKSFENGEFDNQNSSKNWYNFVKKKLNFRLQILRRLCFGRKNGKISCQSF